MQKTEEPTSLFKSKKLVLVPLLFLLSACATAKPHLPMVLAREALASAKEVDASRFAPGFFFKAEEAYRLATGYYNDKSYELSIEKFKLAKEFAEKAENAARLQRMKSGEEAL